MVYYVYLQNIKIKINRESFYNDDRPSVVALFDNLKLGRS